MVCNYTEQNIIYKKKPTQIYNDRLLPYLAHDHKLLFTQRSFTTRLTLTLIWQLNQRGENKRRPLKWAEKNTTENKENKGNKMCASTVGLYPVAGQIKPYIF